MGLGILILTRQPPKNIYFFSAYYPNIVRFQLDLKNARVKLELNLRELILQQRLTVPDLILIQDKISND